MDNGHVEDNAARIYKTITNEAFAELREIAKMIANRVINSIANSVVITIIKMSPAENRHGHAVFFEGSIAVNRHILPRLKKETLNFYKPRSIS